MVVRDALVQNKYGIHCRPSGLIAKAAQEYASAVRVCRLDDDREVDAESVLGLMGLGLRAGDRVRISVEGPDAEAACRAFVELFEKNYDFER